MNSTMDISTDQKITATEEIADSLQQMDLISNDIHPSIHPSIEKSPNANESMDKEDIIMAERTSTTVDSSSSSGTPVPVNKLDNLYKQKDKLVNLIDLLTTKNLELFIADDIESQEMREENEKKLTSAHEMHSSLVKLISSEIELKNKDKNSNQEPTKLHSSSPDFNTIKSSDLPKFNVNPTASALYQLASHESKGQKTLSSNESSLDLFIREFERRFLDKNISVNDHWLYYLEICFEISDKDFDWFVRHLKSPIKTFKKAITWPQAKQLLRQKYDLASQTTPLQWLQSLSGFNQQPSETLTEAMDRFRLFSLDANVNMDNNVLLVYTFVSRLYSQKFRDIVTQTLKDNMDKKPSVISGNFSTMDSIHAPCNRPIPFPASWNDFESIMIKEMANLENALVDLWKEKQSESNKRNAESSLGNGKLDALAAQTIVPTKKVDTTNNSSTSFHKEITELKRKDFCTFCKVEK